MENIEYRSYQLEENSVDKETMTIRGTAIVVESRSNLLGGCFYETICRSAVNDELIQKNDVKLYLDHTSSMGTFGRSKFGKGNLKLYVTERGLAFECKLPNTERSKELIEGIETGIYDACSFGFLPDKDEWSENSDGTYNRSIKSFRLLDEISILSQLPAYSETDVTCRNLDNFKQKQEAIKQKESEERNKEYDKMIEDIDKLNIEIDFK